MATPSSRGIGKAKPQKGSFPVDHFNECRQLAEQYTACLKDNGGEQSACRELSKEYLECRMQRGLMEQQSMRSLGFDITPPVESHDADNATDAAASSDARAQARQQQQHGYVAGTKRSGR